MLKITNISKNLSFAGLYPGESKTIMRLDNKLRKLANQGLIFIQDTTTKTNKDDQSVKTEIK